MKMLMEFVNIAILKMLKINIILTMNVLNATWVKILKYQFIINAIAKKNLFLISKIKVVTQLIISAIVYNHEEIYVDYAMSQIIALL